MWGSEWKQGCWLALLPFDTCSKAQESLGSLFLNHHPVCLEKKSGFCTVSQRKEEKKQLLKPTVCSPIC